MKTKLRLRYEKGEEHWIKETEEGTFNYYKKLLGKKKELNAQELIDSI